MPTQRQKNDDGMNPNDHVRLSALLGAATRNVFMTPVHDRVPPGRPYVLGRVHHVDPRGFHGRNISPDELHDLLESMPPMAGDYSRRDHEDYIDRILEGTRRGMVGELPPGPTGGLTPNNRPPQTHMPPFWWRYLEPIIGPWPLQRY
jgi:hypothetical protein